MAGLSKLYPKLKLKAFFPSKSAKIGFKYHMLTIITRSRFETALDLKPRILDPKIEQFPDIVHELSVTLTALQYKPTLPIAKIISV